MNLLIQILPIAFIVVVFFILARIRLNKVRSKGVLILSIWCLLTGIINYGRLKFPTQPLPDLWVFICFLIIGGLLLSAGLLFVVHKYARVVTLSAFFSILFLSAITILIKPSEMNYSSLICNIISFLIVGIFLNNKNVKAQLGDSHAPGRA